MTLKPVSDVSPTEWEWDNLRHVYDDIPIKIFLVAIAELAERFTYRSVSAPIREYYHYTNIDKLTRVENYIQHPRYSEKHTGALGKVLPTWYSIKIELTDTGPNSCNWN